LTKSGADFRRVNVEGTRNIIACCRQHGLKLVHISSSAIYGLPDDVPITASTPYHPIEVYGRSKLAAEQEVWEFMEGGGRATCIRPRTTVGGEQRLGIFQILFEWISEGRNIFIIGDGSNLFQFVHISDLVDAIIKAALSERNGLYNIGADRYGTLREDLEALLAHAGTGSRIRSIPFSVAQPLLFLADIARLSPLAPWHYLTYHKPFVFDITRAREELNWRPVYSNREALIASYDWYLRHRQDRGGTASSVHTRPVSQGILKLLKYFS
jgi:nucleoside-diphosphate-sugar epimerase